MCFSLLYLCYTHRASESEQKEVLKKIPGTLVGSSCKESSIEMDPSRF